MEDVDTIGSLNRFVLEILFPVEDVDPYVIERPKLTNEELSAIINAMKNTRTMMSDGSAKKLKVRPNCSNSN